MKRKTESMIIIFIKLSFRFVCKTQDRIWANIAMKKNVLIFRKSFFPTLIFIYLSIKSFTCLLKFMTPGSKVQALRQRHMPYGHIVITY